MLSRDQFLNLRTIAPTVEAVETPHGTVYVRVMTAGEMDRFQDEHLKAPNKNFRGRVLIATACDEKGNLLFTYADLRDIAQIPCDVVDPVVQAAVRLNAMREEDAEALKKKSEDPDDDDSSGSRVPLDGHPANSRSPARPLS